MKTIGCVSKLGCLSERKSCMCVCILKGTIGYLLLPSLAQAWLSLDLLSLFSWYVAEVRIYDNAEEYRRLL